MRTKSLLEHNLPLILALIVIVTLIIVIQSFQLPVQSHNAKVGCVMIGASQDHGWNESHYTGLLEACRAHDSELLVRENVAEDEESLSSAIDSLIKQGCTVVFLTSFGYGNCAAESVRRHPKVAFFSISGSHRADNYTTYFARLYQVRYLAGIIAGRESKSGILGYVAAMPNAQTLRGINAYALGARHANPKARILLRYTGSWDNEQEERRSVALLQEAGADLITYHEDHPYVIREAESRGLLSIGHDNVYEHYSPRFLTAAVYDWKVIYKRVLGDYLSGRTNFNNGTWLGLEDGAVRLYPLSVLVSKETARLCEQERERLMTTSSVFSGLIYDNQGLLRCGEGERIKDQELFVNLDWYVQGVELYE